jgi:hypothetical protein
VHRIQLLRELRRPAVKPLAVLPFLAQHLDHSAADDVVVVTFLISSAIMCCRGLLCAVHNGGHHSVAVHSLCERAFGFGAGPGSFLLYVL